VTSASFHPSCTINMRHPTMDFPPSLLLMLMNEPYLLVPTLKVGKGRKFYLQFYHYVHHRAYGEDLISPLLLGEAVSTMRVFIYYTISNSSTACTPYQPSHTLYLYHTRIGTWTCGIPKLHFTYPSHHLYSRSVEKAGREQVGRDSVGPGENSRA
jgi:hypothetical protein